MLFEERYSQIIKLLEEKEFLKTSEMMDTFGISHETARRDLEVLQERGFARRIRGGAVYTQPKEKSQSNHEYEFHRENLAVAKVASRMVKPGSFIYLDAGRTMTHMAGFLKNTPNINIVTPNMLIVNEIGNSQNIKLHLLGGVYDCDEFVLRGFQTEQSFRHYNFDFSFMSCGGISLASGKINDYDNTGLSRELIREQSKKFVMIMNSSKINKFYPMNLFEVQKLDTVIVDSNITPEDEEVLRSLVPELIIADISEIPEEN